MTATPNHSVRVPDAIWHFAQLPAKARSTDRSGLINELLEHAVLRYTGWSANELRLRYAYAVLTRPNACRWLHASDRAAEWVSLYELRDQLPDMPARWVDYALRTMSKAGQAELDQEAQPSDELGQAAVHVAGCDYHYVRLP